MAGEPLSMISRSVAQIATASIRTSTSARLGTGTGFSVRRKLVRATENPRLHGVRNRHFGGGPHVGRSNTSRRFPSSLGVNSCSSSLGFWPYWSTNITNWFYLLLESVP